jgi:hypothetical protein
MLNGSFKGSNELMDISKNSRFNKLPISSGNVPLNEQY